MEKPEAWIIDVNFKNDYDIVLSDTDNFYTGNNVVIGNGVNEKAALADAVKNITKMLNKLKKRQMKTVIYNE